jgi:hypothetical protein
VGFGRPDLLDNPEQLLELSSKAQFAAIEATERLFTYLAGWGVEDDPPAEDLETLTGLGYPADKPHLARAHWLRYLVLEDEDEVSNLISAVMTVTMQEAMEQEQAEDGG